MAWDSESRGEINRLRQKIENKDFLLKKMTNTIYNQRQLTAILVLLILGLIAVVIIK